MGPGIEMGAYMGTKPRVPWGPLGYPWGARGALCDAFKIKNVGVGRQGAACRYVNWLKQAEFELAGQRPLKQLL